jgi:flagellar secretion chaperone FliS
MYATNARNAYVDNSVATASPARLVVMLFERLVLDVERGLAAQQAENWQDAHQHLLHAQDIVMELESSLDVDQMPGGAELMGLYEYLRNRLVLANVRRRTGITQQALIISRHLCDTWRQAALAAAVQ